MRAWGSAMRSDFLSKVKNKDTTMEAIIRLRKQNNISENKTKDYLIIILELSYPKEGGTVVIALAIDFSINGLRTGG